MKAHRSVVLFGVLAAGLVFSQAGCTSGEGQSNGPVGFNSPSVASSAPSAEAEATPTGDTPSPSTDETKAAAGPDAILAGKRQVVIRPIPSTESIVAVDAKGRLSLTDGDTEHGLFVLTPSGDDYLIKTAKAEAGGEPSCMGVKSNGSSPLTVVATTCDAGRAGQLFKITKQKEKDSAGRPTYAIANQGAFLQVFSKYGLIAQELGDSPLETTYAFVDNGPSTLPSLD